MANRRHLCMHFPECFVWVCRIWGIFTAIVFWGVGAEVAIELHPLAVYLLFVGLVVSLCEVVFIIHFWLIYRSNDERSQCLRFCSTLSLLDNWKKGLLYLMLAPACFSQAHLVWIPVIPGVLLAVSGILYCIKTVTMREDAAIEEADKNETYGRFDEVQEDIDENLTETMESVTPDEPTVTVADQDEIMDV